MTVRAGLTQGIALFLACWGSTAAADTFTPPEGCTAYLTVHTMSCRVSNHYTCEQAPGHRWRMDFDAEGATFVSRIDAEAQWVHSRSLIAEDSNTTLFPAADPASMTTLLRDGFDDYDFEQQQDDGTIVRVVGVDRLTGESVEIDGEPLLRTTYSYSITDTRTGQVLDRGEGREFVSQAHRRFFSGIRILQTPDGEVQQDLTPLRFVYPGQPGFGATTPLHDCGVMISSLPDRSTGA